MIPGFTEHLYNGIKIIGSPAMPSEATRPKKTHRKKRWMRDSYHKRIQKKWNKRFGMELVRPMYVVSGNLITHPANVGYIKAQLAKGTA